MRAAAAYLARWMKGHRDASVKKREILAEIKRAGNRPSSSSSGSGAGTIRFEARPGRKPRGALAKACAQKDAVTQQEWMTAERVKTGAGRPLRRRGQ